MSATHSAWRTALSCLALLSLCAFARPAIGGATAVEYFHAEFGHYFLTANADEIAALDRGAFAGWARTGKTIPVFESAAGGALPVCRFFSASFAPKSSHFYTPVAEECEWVKHNAVWTYEGVAFYLRMPDTNGQCPLGSQRLYRFYNDGKTGAPNHRYLTSDPLGLEGMQASGWVIEGTTPDGVFACARADDAPSQPSDGLKGTVELAPNVRVLTPVEVAKITTLSETTMILADPLGLAPGDVIIIDDIGGFRVGAIANGGRSVTIEEVSIDELYTTLELEGEVSLVPAGKVRILDDAWSKMLAEPEIEFYSHRTLEGEQGIRADLKVKAECNVPGMGASFEFIDGSLGIYNRPYVKASKTKGEYSVGNTKVVFEAALRVGCRLAAAKTWLRRLIPIPTQVPLATLWIRAGGELAGSVDLLPVVQLASVSIEGTAGEAQPLKVYGKVPDRSTIVAAVASQTGVTMSAEASAKFVTELTLDAPITIAGLGAKAGPTASLRATMSAQPSICLTVEGVAETYLKYRAPISLKTQQLTSARVELYRGFDSTCGGNAGAGPSGQWTFTVLTCETIPTGCGYCVSPRTAQLSLTQDESKLSFAQQGQAPVVMNRTSPRQYAGCQSLDIATQQCLAMAFDPSDWSQGWLGLSASNGLCTVNGSWKGARDK